MMNPLDTLFEGLRVLTKQILTEGPPEIMPTVQCRACKGRLLMRYAHMLEDGRCPPCTRLMAPIATFVKAENEGDKENG